MPPHDPGGALFWVALAGAREMEVLNFPKFDYYLDESDPDAVIVRRQDGTFVAAFRRGVPPQRASSKPPGRIIGSSLGRT